MKLLMIFVNAVHADSVEALLERLDIPGYSQIDTVLGKGSTGHKLGTRAFPGSSTLYFAAVAPDRADALVEEVKKLEETCGAEGGLKMYGLDATELV